MVTSEIKRDVYARLRSSMQELGLEKIARRQQYRTQLGDDVSGFVAFADATKKTRDTLWINVSVALVCDEVESLISEWCGDSIEQPVTVQVNVGYLETPAHWFEVDFGTDKPIGDGVVKLLEAVRLKALPFLEGHSTLAPVADLFEKGLPMAPRHREERLPLLFALSGEIEKGYAMLGHIMEKVESGENLTLLPRRLAYIDGFTKRFPRVSM
ncbi:hypothetical protein [Streptomyces tritici]|uniref:hypothetical protein n=1 Tax=Streptomyces tritici TaxID=2054410 RepID=UPI003AF09142